MGRYITCYMRTGNAPVDRLGAAIVTGAYSRTQIPVFESASCMASGAMSISTGSPFSKKCTFMNVP